ncbi:uncharacterized protein LOC113017806 isoform X2 [Astatotilapia calliptera]|uniref:uncharacterized protein LOC113017806 isoform X2 n=1 Tax=Astatotilapia calliptera TaxID=8154 RepID=UPI000E42870E|nr:uncharacterized protein LOC113017806 isoform X2 [Astatotilapia calliptera]
MPQLMKFPVEDVAVPCELWYTLDSCDCQHFCTENTAHRPHGNEGVYDRKILRNWRNFLRMRGHEDTMEWQLQTMQHNKRQDSCSCGVLLLKFAEHYLDFGEVSEVSTTTEPVVLERMQIACTLLENRGNAEDYCIVCSMLDANADRSMIEMVQCESCQRWAHFACEKYKESNQEYKCQKCSQSQTETVQRL